MKLVMPIKPGDKVKLDAYDTEPSAQLREEEAKERLSKLSAELGKLQEQLYAARLNSLLIILQGMDTSGKDGTIKHVMSEVNPQGCRVESFRAPTEEERAHDFLWRVHKVAPPNGIMTIFNRSHYEDVLAARVHELVPQAVWKPRYDHINGFERQLTDSGTIILKFYLHISRVEQKKRLEARERNAEKAWKLSVGDWQERRLWEEYMRAYEDAIERCATDHAPWHVIPADKKWYRNLAVADAIVQTLKPYRERWEQSLENQAKIRRAELTLMRDEGRK